MLPLEQTTIPFITDAAAKRLRQLENALRDLEAKIPALAREAGELATMFEPRQFGVGDGA
jgi:hypothetical protein